MTAWGNKKPNEVRTRTYVLPSKMVAAGVTIRSITSVSASVLETSPVKDANPTAILNGSAQLNSVMIIDGNRVTGISQAVMQSITGGLAGCIYVVTFTLVLSTGETLIRDCIQAVTEYVPAL